MNERFAATLAGDDWPKVDYAPARYRTVPSQGQRDKELEHYAVYLAAEAGLHLDPWEEDVLLDSLRLRPDGTWGAIEVGICCPRQNGKNPYNVRMPILTTDGWTTIGDIQVGQFVYGSNGKPTRVIGRSEVFLGERCYEVEFTDGSKHIVGQDHLWHVWDLYAHDAEKYALAGGNLLTRRRAGKGAWVNLPTRQIAESQWGSRRADTGRMGYRYRVQCDAIPETPATDLLIPPYAFGLWLGDGNSQAASLTVGAEDLVYMRQRIVDAGYDIAREYQDSSQWRAWHIAFHLSRKWNPDGFPARLRQLGVFGNKHIPEAYLTASPEQRLALLQGLMDTDGSIGTSQNKSPQVEFSTSSPALAESFHRLARSLGIRVTPKWRKTARKDSCRFLWTPTFNPFRLPRKAERFRPPDSRRHELMSITGIREVPSVPVRCIQVEADDGVYLAGETFVPTHNSILEARELLGLFVDERRFPGVGSRLTVHTAHEAKTAHEAFERLESGITNTPRLRAQLSGKPRHSEGGEVIRLRNGRRIRFRTRTSGGGRGLSGDLLVFDEAMILMGGVHEAVWPIVTARPNSQIWYTGSAVDKNEPLMDEHGIVFSRVRKRGIAGDADLLYCEWSLPYENPDEVPPLVAADPEAWARSNPGLDVRLSRRIITVEQRSLSHRGFARERLGVADWPDPDQSNRVIDEAKWATAALDKDSLEAIMQDPVCFAVDVSPGRTRAAIGVAGRNAGGKNQVEVVKRFRGTSGVIPTLLELIAKHGRRCEVMVDGVGAAASLIPAMERERLNVVPVTAGEHARGCGMFYDGIVGDEEINLPPTLNHLSDPALNAAVQGAAKRPLGERWAWSRKESTIDISPLVATTLALYGYLRKRAETYAVYGIQDLEEDETMVLVPSDLPPLDEEDL